MATTKNLVLLLLISLIYTKCTLSFSDYKSPLPFKVNHMSRPQFAKTNSSHKNENYSFRRLLRENRESTSHGNSIGVNTMPMQIMNHRQKTFHFHWDLKSSGYRQLLNAQVSNVAYDERRLTLMKSIPMNVFIHVLLTISLNVFVTILIRFF